MITRIPRHSVIRPVSPSRMHQMFDVEWQGEHYAAFEVDLRERCEEAEQAGRPQPMRQARIA